MKTFLLLLFGPAVFSMQGAVISAQSCKDLSALTLDHVTITRAETAPAGSFTPPKGKAVEGLPEFCRVAGVIKPTSDSNIQFEVWMPSSGWNGKFYGVGNGGFAGDINYGQLADGVKHGFATASTDTGHSADGVGAVWALRHPEKITDFGHRAIHETAVNGKRIVAAFYGSGAKRSFFSSCSNGGRQALMEAQRYPEDYDGIIAGAPANYWTHLLANAASNMRAMGSSESFIPAKKLPAIEKAVLDQCDSADGVKDGVIESPPACRFDTSVLKCQGEETDNCLTQPQLTALNTLYAGSRYANGKPAFPGYSPGGEAESGGWAIWTSGTAPEHSLMYSFGTQFYKNMVFDDPAWDYHKFDLERDTKVADTKLAQALNATDPDLSKFQARGGKLILYHGWSDAAIPAQNAIDYYESVVARMGRAKTDQFVRLYMVPGMQHCFGGPGPNSFGQFGFADGDPASDIAAALERWVTEGTAPETIVAAKRKNDFDPKSPAIRTRPLCVYPKTARYKGTGDTNDAANFTCENQTS